VAIDDNEVPRTIVFGSSFVQTALFGSSPLPNTLVEFAAATPGTIRRTTPVLGLGGDSLVGLDFRPATGQLFGLVLGNFQLCRLVTINPATGFTAQVGGLFATGGVPFGFDFNPTNDRIRVTSTLGFNLSIDPNTGAAAVQPPLNPGRRDIVGAAHTNSFAGAGSTTLYAIDWGPDQLFIENPAQSSTLDLVGDLNVETSGFVGFDIVPFNNQALASLTATGAGSSRLFSVNLGTGAASLIGPIAGPPMDSLTTRTVVTAGLSANGRFVSQLYLDLLGRPSDPAGQQGFTALLDQGVSRADVARAILSSE
jgi:hypothetical protein